MNIQGEHWVIDDAKTRSYDGKRLRVDGKYIYTMHIRECDSDGAKKPGYIQVILEPYDLESALHDNESTPKRS